MILLSFKKFFLIIGIIVVTLSLFGVYSFNHNLTYNTEVKLLPLNASAVAQDFNGSNALNYAVNICQLGPRYDGNAAELQAANIMANQFQSDGLSVNKEKVDLGNGQYTYNVIGLINGTDSNRYVIVGCHIDSPGSSQGAVDDAAGVGIEMEMAQLLGKSVKPNETILLIGFGAEELWFNGSEAFVAQNPGIVANADAMIDMNAVGAGDTVTPIGQSSLPATVNGSPVLINLLLQSANTLGIPASIGGDAYPSDTYPFYNNNISVVEVESQPFDVPPMDSSDASNYLDLNNIQQMGETVTMALLNLTNAQRIQITNKTI